MLQSCMRPDSGLQHGDLIDISTKLVCHVSIYGIHIEQQCTKSQPRVTQSGHLIPLLSLPSYLLGRGFITLLPTSVVNMQYTLPITQPSLHGVVHMHIYIIEAMDSFI